jgi:hypothetical protein
MNKLIKTIVLIVIVSSLTSCYTIQEMSGNDRTKNLRCTQVSR